MGLRAVLADDDVLLREGLASLLQRSGVEVVAQAGDATALLELVREHGPDIVLVDIRMPPTHTTEGLDAARAIRAALPEVGHPRAVRLRGGRARHGAPGRGRGSATSSRAA